MSSLPTSRSPVEFTCTGCQTVWVVPPDHCCPNCGPHPAELDPRIWELGWVNDRIILTGALMSEERVEEVLRQGVRAVVDCTCRPHDDKFVWAGEADYLKSIGLPYIHLNNFTDMGEAPPKSWFRQAIQAIEHMSLAYGPTIVHCAAGIRRSPHAVYATLRNQGMTPVDAWDLILDARPIASPLKLYVDCAEQALFLP